MKKFLNKKTAWITAVVVFLFIILLIIIASYQMATEVDEIKQSRIKKFQIPQITKIIRKLTLRKKKKVFSDVIRKARLDPGRKYSQSIFYEKDQEIARYKSYGDFIYDVKGKIPDAKVKFFDDNEKTYGEEQYKHGKRNGPYIEYYSEGQLKREAFFLKGQARRDTIYYIDGTVRMDINLEDALIFSNDTEVGVGKVYYRDGTIKYEWNLTNTGEVRFKKAYNQNGELIAESYFDVFGDLIEDQRRGTIGQIRRKK